MSGRTLGADPSLPRRNSGCRSPRAGLEGAAKHQPRRPLPLIPPGHLHGHRPTPAPAPPGHDPGLHPTAPTPAALPDTARSQEAGPGPGPSLRPLPHPQHLPHIDLPSEPRESRPRRPGKQGECPACGQVLAGQASRGCSLLPPSLSLICVWDQRGADASGELFPEGDWAGGHWAQRLFSRAALTLQCSPGSPGDGAQPWGHGSSRMFSGLFVLACSPHCLAVPVALACYWGARKGCWGLRSHSQAL